MHKRGHRVLACVRTPSKASALSTLSNVFIITLDVTSPTSISSVVDTVREHTGTRGLDILINNAGHGAPTIPLVDADLEYGRRMFEVNFWGVLSMVQAFAPLVVQAKGTIVNISSIGAIMNTPYLGLYDSSKAAIMMATDTLRVEMKPLGVKVITSMVGMVESKFHDNLTEVVIRDDSMYKPAEKWIKMSATPGQGSMKRFEMPLEKFSERFAEDVLKGGSNGRIWRGGMSTICRVLKWLLPVSLLVSDTEPFSLNRMIIRYVRI